MGKYSEHDLEVDFEEEPNGRFDSLFDSHDYCYDCGYEGPLTLRKHGYVCPECKALLLPTE
jgi:hypothetical protein